MTAQEIEKLAETQWEGCHGCDENDKMFWINGFVVGYLNARLENLEEKVELGQKRLAELLINNEEIPSKKTWITSKNDKAFIQS